MALDVAQQHALDLAVHLEVEDRRIEPLVLAGEPGLFVLELDAGRRGLAAVDDGRHEARMTKAAARTLPLVLAARGLDGVLVCHFGYSLCLHGNRLAAALATPPRPGEPGGGSPRRADRKRGG